MNLHELLWFAILKTEDQNRIFEAKCRLLALSIWSFLLNVCIFYLISFFCFQIVRVYDGRKMHVTSVSENDKKCKYWYRLLSFCITVCSEISIFVFSVFIFYSTSLVISIFYCLHTIFYSCPCSCPLYSLIISWRLLSFDCKLNLAKPTVTDLLLRGCVIQFSETCVWDRWSVDSWVWWY